MLVLVAVVVLQSIERHLAAFGGLQTRMKSRGVLCCLAEWKEISSQIEHGQSQRQLCLCIVLAHTDKATVINMIDMSSENAR